MFLKYISYVTCARVCFLFILTVIRLRHLRDICCFFYKHTTSRLYDRTTYLCSMKLTFKMAPYEVRNGQMAARCDAHVSIRKAGKYPLSRGTSFTCAHLVYRSH